MSRNGSPSWQDGFSARARTASALAVVRLVGDVDDESIVTAILDTTRCRTCRDCFHARSTGHRGCLGGPWTKRLCVASRLARARSAATIRASDQSSERNPTASSSAGQRAGGATVRIWTNVTNPNPFGFTLSTLQVTLLLEDTEAANADFPLGLPLQPRQTETIPLDLTVSFDNVPRLASVIRATASGRGLDYRLEGTIGIHAGRLGEPTFGPMTILSGSLRPRF